MTFHSFLASHSIFQSNTGQMRGSEAKVATFYIYIIYILYFYGLKRKNNLVASQRALNRDKNNNLQMRGKKP
jgi:hypothetical protein